MFNVSGICFNVFTEFVEIELDKLKSCSIIDWCTILLWSLVI